MDTKKFRFLTLALIFSGALNIGLVVSIVFFQNEEGETSALYASKKKIEMSNSEQISSMTKLSFRELVSYLTNRELVEEGYTKRDLALASLVAFHHFNLEKALSSAPSQVRPLTLSNGQKIDLFPSFTEDEFEAIIRFAYQEKWPLTAKGLFSHLKNQREESLDQAFAMSPEFYTLKLLFQKTGAAQENSTLLDMVKEGSWDLLQYSPKDFTPENRRSLLLNYVAMGSATAADLLLSTDFIFALKKMEDRDVLDLLSLLKAPSEAAKKFCAELKRAPRSDQIWRAATEKFNALGGEELAVQETVSAPPAPAAVVVQGKFHVVKEGESLWKISRQYQVKVDEIVKVNGLDKDALYPGMTLKIP